MRTGQSENSRLKCILNSYGALDVTLGKNVKPVDPGAGTTNEDAHGALMKSIATWNKLDAIAQKVIVTTVGEQPTLHIINCTTTAEMWQ